VGKGVELDNDEIVEGDIDGMWDINVKNDC
jgi:hypothetical protein